MELKKIRALAELMNAQGLTHLTLTEENETLELRREVAAPAPAVAVAPVAPAAPAQPVEMATESQEPAQETAQRGRVFTSPMVGVAYLAPAPGEDPFVKPGSTVKKGDVLCIIEAMKLMNEITAEQDCTILEVCVENAQVVEYGQPLFRYQ